MNFNLMMARLVTAFAIRDGNITPSEPEYGYRFGETMYRILVVPYRQMVGLQVVLYPLIYLPLHEILVTGAFAGIFRRLHDSNQAVSPFATRFQFLPRQHLLSFVVYDDSTHANRLVIQIPSVEDMPVVYQLICWVVSAVSRIPATAPASPRLLEEERAVPASVVSMDPESTQSDEDDSSDDDSESSDESDQMDALDAPAPTFVATMSAPAPMMQEEQVWAYMLGLHPYYH